LKISNVSIATRLYFVVGVMAALIACELFTLRFAMKNLSAARAFVGGESLWSKAQKNAVFSLQRFAVTKDEKDYKSYEEYLKIPEGDHGARLELQKPQPDMEVIRKSFLQGHIHPDDIQPMVELLRKFYWISYLARAIDAWTKADVALYQLKDVGTAYHDAIVAGDHARAAEVFNQISGINEDLTVLEENFSYALGEGSRWLEHMVLSILTLTVLTVETFGLTLAFFTSRAISRGLKELNSAAQRIGEGDFDKRVLVHSGDEIGELGTSLNMMGELLKKSYGKLEERVRERTAELAKMVTENAQLYEEAKIAVQMRDEFLSIASHELKTPLTALFLQLQLLAQALRPKNGQAIDTVKMSRMVELTVAQSKRITILLEELLDLTRLRVGKFQLHKAPCDLVTVVKEVVTQLTPEAQRVGVPVTLEAVTPVMGEFDSTRIGQVVTNLISNAIKYGEGSAVKVSVQDSEGKVFVKVKDSGPGIPKELQEKIFERFERAEADPSISGLGLGLYISQQIVKAHGGIILVESALGEGSTFTVAL